MKYSEEYSKKKVLGVPVQKNLEPVAKCHRSCSQSYESPDKSVLNELLDEPAWIRASDDIRKYHELTHFVCRRLYPDLIDKVRDELIADAVGICAAFGEYRRDLKDAERRYF